MEIILETNNLEKKYKDFRALNYANIHVEKGAIYGLIGKNGAGKTTLIRIICGLQEPTSGSYTIYGKDNNSGSDIISARKRMGAIIETPSIYGEMTARDNLIEQYKLVGMPSTDGINELLKLVGLDNTGKKKAGQFSMGMKQRLGIAIALLNHPSLLILDEPTNGLDPIGIGELRNLIRSFPQQGITVILSSHILSEVQLIADDIGIIANGTLGYEGEMQHSGNLEELFLKVVEESRR